LAEAPRLKSSNLDKIRQRSRSAVLFMQ
jgi:hypothetical protein